MWRYKPTTNYFQNQFVLNQAWAVTTVIVTVVDVVPDGDDGIRDARGNLPERLVQPGVREAHQGCDVR